MSSLNIPFRNLKSGWGTASSFNSVVDRFRSYAPKTKSNFMFFLALILSLSFSLSYFCFGSSIFCETEIYKIICVLTWKTNIVWRNYYYFFKLIKFKVEEFKKLKNGVKPNLLIFYIYGLNWSIIRRWGDMNA